MTARSLKHLPKAHLHLHLEGSMRPQTLTEYCERYNLDRPNDTRGKQFSNFLAFNAVYRAASESIRTKEDLARVIQEVAEDAAEDGATWIEPAFDADRYTILRADSPYKLFETSEEGWAFVLHAAQITSEKTGVGIGFISAIDRTRSLEQAVARAQLTSNLIASKSHLINPKNINNGEAYSGIAGLGLHGNEEGYPPELFMEAFQIGAKAEGLLLTPHAGEIAPSPGKGPDSVDKAIDLLGASRIQHGVLAIEDEALMKKIREKNICLDVCPSSNIQLSVFPTIQSHPLPRFIEAGIACSIGSDDPLLFGPSLLDEFNLCREEMLLDDNIIAQLARNSFNYSGAPKKVRDKGLQGIEDWLN